MATRLHYIKMILRQIYGAQPSEDSNITNNLVNIWMNQGIALAAKQNYRDNIQIDGIGYINNSFYTTYSNLAITSDATDNFLYQFSLPLIPLAMGYNEGVAQVRFLGSDGSVSYTGVPLSMNQASFADRMRPLPNKILYWTEGLIVRCRTTIPLFQFKAIVKMVSAGDDTNLNSTLIIPDDYLPIVIEYVQKQLVFERNQPTDAAADGEDFIKTT